MHIEHLQCAQVAMAATLNNRRLRSLCHVPDNTSGWCGCDLEDWFSTAWEAAQSDPNLTKLTRVNGELVPRAVRYRGTLPTRISQYAHARGYTLTADYLSELGNLLRRETAVAETWHLDFVDLGRARDIPWRAGAFGDEKSCYWGSRASARMSLCWYGAWAVRVYDAAGYGMGRAWLLPILDGALTTMPQAESLIVWNGYLPSGHVDSETKTIARVLQEFSTAETVTRVVLTNTVDSDLYINNSGAYWVGTGAAPHAINLAWHNIDTCGYCGVVLGPYREDVFYCADCAWRADS